jgi:putative flavoprotein involved in K+ transport
MSKLYEVIVVGAGFAGLCAGHFLKKKGFEPIIFERGKIGESWRSQRWDSFRFNSTNKLNLLPGESECGDPDGFGTAPAFVHKLEAYVSLNALPVHENSNVISIERSGDDFHVKVLSNGVIENYFSKQVLIASGACNEIIIPSLAKDVPTEIKQFHTSEYKNEKQLPGGAVLVVGGAQSGIQVTEDLVNAGRKVFFATSKVGRIPRWYRGQDIFYWVKDAKFYDIKAAEIEDPNLLDLKPPHVSGTGDGKTTLSLQSLAKRGVIILGKLDKFEGVNAFFASNAAEHVRFADEFSQKIKKAIDEYIEKNKLTAPSPHFDEADQPDINEDCASLVTSLNLKDMNIHTIIWATGFDYDLGYIKLPVLDEKKKLIHNEGLSDIPGLYFLGYPWMRSRKSPILFGIIEDAEYIANKLYEYAKVNFIPSRS